MKHALTTYREDKRLTLEAFASRIGASKGMVWKWENGALPRKVYMERISSETNGTVTPNDWFQTVEAAE